MNAQVGDSRMRGLVNTVVRPNQASVRQALIEAYDGKCCMSGGRLPASDSNAFALASALRTATFHQGMGYKLGCLGFCEDCFGGPERESELGKRHETKPIP